MPLQPQKNSSHGAAKAEQMHLEEVYRAAQGKPTGDFHRAHYVQTRGRSDNDQGVIDGVCGLISGIPRGRVTPLVPTCVRHCQPRLISKEDFPANATHHECERFSFSFDDITAELNNPNRVHNRNRSSVQPIKFHVKIDHDTRYKYVNCSLNRTETTIIEYVKRKERDCRFDMDKLKNFSEAHEILSIMLALVGISRDDASNKCMVDQIIVQGLILGNKLSSMGRKVLGLRVYMRTEQVKSRCESCMRLLEIVMSSGNNKGMVPASDSAVEMVLKRVRVGADDKGASCCEEEGRERKRRKVCVSESDSCTVCMEEFNGGSEVACMPCSHVFHDKCIRTWLRQSHYCPVCRFEVPTAVLIEENLA